MMPIWTYGPIINIGGVYECSIVLEGNIGEIEGLDATHHVESLVGNEEGVTSLQSIETAIH